MCFLSLPKVTPLQPTVVRLTLTTKTQKADYWTAGYKDGYTRGGALFYHYEATGGDKDISPLTNSNDGAARWIGRAIIPTTEE